MTLYSKTSACSVLILCCQPLAANCSETVLKASLSNGRSRALPRASSGHHLQPQKHTKSVTVARARAWDWAMPLPLLQGLQMTPPTLCAARRRRARNNRAAEAQFLAACREPGLPSQGAGKLGSTWSDHGRSDSDLKCTLHGYAYLMRNCKLASGRAIGAACAWQTQDMMSGQVYDGSG